MIDTAKRIDISLQVSTADGGETDGGPIDLHKMGEPTVVISVPTRHIHSHNGIIRQDDFDHAVELATALVLEPDSDTVNTLTSC